MGDSGYDLAHCPRHAYLAAVIPAGISLTLMAAVVHIMIALTSDMALVGHGLLVPTVFVLLTVLFAAAAPLPTHCSCTEADGDDTGADDGGDA